MYIRQILKCHVRISYTNLFIKYVKNLVALAMRGSIVDGDGKPINQSMLMELTGYKRTALNSILNSLCSKK